MGTFSKPHFISTLEHGIPVTPSSSEPTIAVIGAGNLGGCFISGLLDSGVAPRRLTAVDLLDDLLSPLAQRGLRTSTDISTVSTSDVVFVAVKPQVARHVLRSLALHLSQEQLVVSAVAGVTTSTIEDLLPPSRAVVRVMPQTLVRLRAGATALCAGRHAGPAAVAAVRALFDRLGTTVEVRESRMDAVTGMSGSGPAYIYTVIEALADGGVEAGLAPEVAMALAAQTVNGAARMVQEGVASPAELRDQVTSPGGTTLAGLTALEEGGLRQALAAAVAAATRRSKELGT